MSATSVTKDKFCDWLKTLYTSRLSLPAILVGCLVLSACSTRFFYERLDWFIGWEIGGYVSLTNEQEDALPTDLPY